MPPPCRIPAARPAYGGAATGLAGGSAAVMPARKIGSARDLNRAIGILPIGKISGSAPPTFRIRRRDRRL
jgi:hypothetical protein